MKTARVSLSLEHINQFFRIGTPPGFCTSSTSDYFCLLMKYKQEQPWLGFVFMRLSRRLRKQPLNKENSNGSWAWTLEARTTILGWIKSLKPGSANICFMKGDTMFEVQGDFVKRYKKSRRAYWVSKSNMKKLSITNLRAFWVILVNTISEVIANAADSSKYLTIRMLWWIAVIFSDDATPLKSKCSIYSDVWRSKSPSD